MSSSVELIDHMGTDLTVVNAARVSFAKESFWEGIPFNDFGDARVLQEKDHKLIKYLAKHGHWTPFAHATLTFRIKAPIFVARQLVKHQVGLAWNEVSRRYVSDTPTTWHPDWWRKQSEDKKQVSSEEPIEQPHRANDVYAIAIDTAVDTYELLIKLGVAAEQARAVLPLATYTEWYWTGSLYAFSRVYKLRCDKLSQPETGDIAKDIGFLASQFFPASWEALTVQDMEHGKA
jgi:thymidylate synthase (FAD)